MSRHCRASLTLAACCAVLMTAGCDRLNRRTPPAGTQPLGAVDREVPVEVDGIERNCLVHLPASYDSSRPVPLVLVFHGGEGNPQRVAQVTGFSRLSDEQGFLVAYPEALEGHWNDGRASPRASQAHDVAFISRLIDKLSILLSIDPARIYAAGVSNGGIFTQRLGCELSDKLAAIASVAGPLAREMADKCTPPMPVSVLMVHGTADGWVPYGGGEVRGPVGGRVLSVAQTLDRWLTANGCQDRTPRLTQLDADARDGTRVRREAYTGRLGSEVVLYTVEGGGHTWPGSQVSRRSSRLVGPTSLDFDATQAIWEFFQTHPNR